MIDEDTFRERVKSVPPPAPRSVGGRRTKRASQATKQKRKVTAAKTRLTKELEKLRKLEQEQNPVAKVVAPAIVSSKEDAPEVEPKSEAEEEEVVFRPNPGPQTKFLAASEREVLFGGSSGGGKSYAMLADPCRWVHRPAHRALLLRRTNDELRELIFKSQELYPRAFPGAKWSERKSSWTFPSGAQIWMTYLEQDKDVMRYQGQSFTYIGVDELTQYPTPFAWDYLRSRLRTTDSELPTYMRACVDEGEVLTSGGWKNIVDIRVGDTVFGLTPDGELVQRRVHTAAEYDVDEELVRVRKKNLYMSMTADHRVVYRKHSKTTYDIKRWNEHKGRSIDIARTSSSYSAKGYTAPIGEFTDVEYARFIGLFVAEGCTIKPRKGNYKVIITQNKKKNQAFVREVMEAGGYNVCYCKNGDFIITNKALWTHLRPLGKAHEKHFPREFLDKASREQLLEAFNAYALGDGHWQSPKSCTLVTCSKQLADDVQEIAVKLGYKTQYKKTIHKEPQWNDRYTVYVTLRGPTTKVDKNEDGRNDVSYERYTGKVYCIGVEEIENFVIRQRGYVWVSGNTTNPGGPGHTWVKKMFIDPAPPGTAFDATDIQTGEVLRYPDGHEKAGQPLFKRRFIPASLYDNPYLTADGNYEAMLLSLPEVQRRQLLEGSWDVAEGAAFSEFNRNIHVCEPFEIPHDWRRFRAADYGYSTPSAVLWFALDPNYDILYVYRELYEKGLHAVDLAKKVLQMEYKEKIDYGILDSSVWHNRGFVGPSLAEQMISAGCRWRPADRGRGSRVAGKNEIHRRLQVQEGIEKPGLIIFNNCTNLIAQLPSIALDKSNPEDVDTRGEDHLYDALRYGVMSRPKPRSVFDDWYAGHGGERPSSWQPVDPVFGY